MQNERLKYRIFNKFLNKYIEGGCIKFGQVCFINEDGQTIVPAEDQDNYIVEMCTGYMDKNEKWIYEGDIVICDRDCSPDGRIRLIRQVVWADASFKLDRLVNEKYSDLYYLEKYHNIEIIGNIHEA